MSTPSASNRTHESPVPAARADQVQRRPDAVVPGDPQRLEVLQASVYPDCDLQAIEQLVRYCDALGVNPLHKPVHVVCGWDVLTGQFRQSLIPGIGLYRTIAARTGWAGMDEPEFGPDVTEPVGGQQITYPRWCRITVHRRLPSGELVQFTAKEFWRENVALKAAEEGGPGRPNEAWTRRPYGQLAKCTEAQALRKAFPEIGSLPVIEEVDGQRLPLDSSTMRPADPLAAPRPAPSREPDAKPKRRRRSAVAADATSRDALLTPTPAEPSGPLSAPSSGQSLSPRPSALWQMPLTEAAVTAAPPAAAPQAIPSHAIPPQSHGEEPHASPGEQAYLAKLLAAKRMTPAAAFEGAALASRESLEGLTQAEFTALRRVL